MCGDVEKDYCEVLCCKLLLANRGRKSFVKLPSRSPVRGRLQMDYHF
jgi:hypothetical protein